MTENEKIKNTSEIINNYSIQKFNKIIEEIIENQKDKNKDQDVYL